MLPPVEAIEIVPCPLALRKLRIRIAPGCCGKTACAPGSSRSDARLKASATHSDPTIMCSLPGCNSNESGYLDSFGDWAPSPETFHPAPPWAAIIFLPPILTRRTQNEAPSTCRNLRRCLRAHICRVWQDRDAVQFRDRK